MNGRILCIAAACGFATAAFAQNAAREAYQQRQAYQEVQRLSSQFDQLQNGMDSLSSRVAGLESAGRDGDLRAEIAGIKGELAELKRRQEAMRGEIVAEISKKMADLIAKNRPAAQPAAQQGSRQQRAESAATGPTGPYFEHTIEPGETLSYIAKECHTTVALIKQYNNMKNDNLRVGQVLKIPAVDEKAK